MTMIRKAITARQGLLIYIFMFLAVLSLSIIFNIPVLRQILGFIFLTLIPGWLILRIMKLNKLGLTAKFVVSVSLSIAFIMFTGLLIDTLYPFWGL